MLPEASTATQTVWFVVDGQDPDDVLWEGLLTQPAGSDQAIVVAIPAFVDDVTLGDRVEVTRHEKALVATRRVQDAGRFPFRVFFPECEDEENDTRWRDLMVELEPLGCWFDVYSDTLVALSVDGEITGALTDFLDGAQRKGACCTRRGVPSRLSGTGSTSRQRDGAHRLRRSERSGVRW